ncbi:MAG TPA: VCBS repeat-containing protein, partial [Mycobacteriales bacterium]|nr:VCBS repeat-containing protein [Mycobacteriales bacterium]
LDLFVTSWDPGTSAAPYRNKGDGTFEDRSEPAGLAQQLGGYYCVQTDYNNDGHMDVFILRGAWLRTPMRPSLLRNNGEGTFTDVTQEAGLMVSINAISACWADCDNDGWLDLFIAGEQGHNLLFRNKGDGTFEEVAVKAGVAGRGRGGKGASWGDFDGDGYPDLFVNYLDAPPELYRNNKNGTFTEVAASMGILRPTTGGFSAWFFDYDNDGWLDIYANGYDRTLDDLVRSLLGQPTGREVGRLYRNLKGRSFEDVTRAAGLELLMGPMGSNFGDFDNDGYLDFYLGTGEPGLSTLIPNRMFRNVGGTRFAEITTSAGTGHLQKGHGVAIGDWDRDGSVDIFMETGGVTPGDRFRNVLFQNPGQGNHWLTVKLRGVKT